MKMDGRAVKESDSLAAGNNPGFFKKNVKMVSLIQLKNGDFVCGCNNGKIYVLDQHTGKRKQTFRSHTDLIEARMRRDSNMFEYGVDHADRQWRCNKINCVDILYEHSNGDVISAADDNILYIHDAESGKCKMKLEGHDADIVGVGELQNGDIISGSRDRVFYLFDTEFNDELDRPPNHTLRIWDKVTGECKNVIYFDKPICAVKVHPNGKIICGLDNKLIVDNIENIESGKYKLSEGHTKEICAIAILKNGNIITSSYDATMRIWDKDSLECIKVLDCTTVHIRSIVVLNEINIATVADYYTSCIWDIESGVRVEELTDPSHRIDAIIANQDGGITGIAGDIGLRTWSINSVDNIQFPKHHYCYS